MRQGKPVDCAWDGTSLWTITHNSDFAKGLVGLLGHQQAIGHAFHIMSDEVLTFCATTPFARGIQQTLVWFDADPTRQQIDTAADQQWDRLISAYERGLQSAVQTFHR